VLCVRAGALLFLLLPAASPLSSAQDTATSEQQPKNDFFSGVITVLDTERITVSKTVLGKNSDARTFLITKETRIEGKLRLKARVTVRYTHDEEGNRAVHIIVRVSQKK